MTSYFVCDPITGELGQTGLADNWHELPGAEEGTPPDWAYYRLDGEWFPRTEAPTQFHEWNWELHCWLDLRDLDQLRIQRWKELKTLRTQQIEAPKQTSVGVFDANKDAQVNLANVISLTRMAAEKGLPAEANFTLADNSRVTLTLEQLQTAALEMGVQVQAIYDEWSGLRSALQKAKSVEAINAVVWPEI